jgi:anti-sigma regulatory factor (Ser/Thr protein kinase)
VGTISLTLTLTSQPRRLILETMDTGRPFDPTRVPDPDLLNERGRGLYLIRTLMDETTYDARTDQRWQSIGGQPWQTAALPHPQPGSNAWRLVRYL